MYDGTFISSAGYVAVEIFPSGGLQKTKQTERCDRTFTGEEPL